MVRLDLTHPGTGSPGNHPRQCDIDDAVGAADGGGRVRFGGGSFTIEEKNPRMIILSMDDVRRLGEALSEVHAQKDKAWRQ